jgi:hypothetical protein
LDHGYFRGPGGCREGVEDGDNYEDKCEDDDGDGKSEEVTSAHVAETGKQQGEEEVENDKIADEDGGHEVGDARLAADEDAVPHTLYPLATQHTEHDHEAGWGGLGEGHLGPYKKETKRRRKKEYKYQPVHEVCEVPPWHRAAVPVADMARGTSQCYLACQIVRIFRIKGYLT